MSTMYAVPIWKKAPFIRLLIPLTLGILLQWYLLIPPSVAILGFICFGIAYGLFLFFPLVVRFKLQVLQALIINLLIVCLGLIITWQKDIRNSSDWVGNYYQAQDHLVVRIDEPLQQKQKSYKAYGYVESIVNNDTIIDCKGKLIMYFSKDATSPQLKYGDRILIHKNLQPIKNSGNPGAFNYEQYAAMQLTFHQVFLKPVDWMKLDKNNSHWFKQFIFTARQNIVSILQQNLPPSKDELGIAEALLIGYTNDLDRDLVKAYSNTGVVHIIAISGMHLGLIYVLLVWVFAKTPIINQSKILQLMLMLTCLWVFALLTGAAASVLRSAVMFTFIAVGKNIAKKSSIYNSMAASAFVMLCYNPYFLWDVGFQLSYLAVVGIIVFQPVIYNWWFVKNKLANEIWKLMAISLAAQILTFPICIYYFHQFPNLFLLTNIIAVPLSSFILYAEIVLVAFSWVPFVGTYAGKLVATSVGLMNDIVIWINNLSFAVWDKIPATVLSTCLLYAVVASFGAWLILKQKKYFKIALVALIAFAFQNAYNNWQTYRQQKLIVYNVPRYQAIDFINGCRYQFVGDSILLQDGLLQNFHLKPGRIAQQLNERTDSLNAVFKKGVFYQFNNKRIMVADTTLNFASAEQKIKLDLIIISKNPRIRIASLAKTFECKLFVFDASNPDWKIEKWKQECQSLQLKYYCVPETGAFICNIDI